MAFNLISCNNIYPSINGVSLPDFTDYVGSVVTIGNPNQSYTVETVEDGDLELTGITITEVPACVPCVPFDTKISLTLDCCECNSFEIEDVSTYLNSLMGYELNGYRKIIVKDPNGVEYVFSTLASEDPNMVIPIYDIDGNNTFTYPFAENAVDGVYEINLFSFPPYDQNVYYNINLNHVVFYEGVLWQMTASGSENTPTLDSEYWTPYTITSDTLTTRYGEIKRKVVTCIKLDACKDKLIKQAFCDIESNPCSNLCENKKFQQSMKYLVTMEAIRIKECLNDWAGVQKGIEILKSICTCGGC